MPPSSYGEAPLTAATHLSFPAVCINCTGGSLSAPANSVTPSVYNVAMTQTAQLIEHQVDYYNGRLTW